MLQTRPKLTSHDQGKRLSLRAFQATDRQEGKLFELARGVIVVSDVPAYPHLLVIEALRDQLYLYKREMPGEVFAILGAMECKVLIEDFESERHPDLAVFKRPTPTQKKMWQSWIPEIAVEVVSPSSEDRDYVEKREEFLARGIQEYWILDPSRHRMLALRRVRGKWVERFLESGTYTTKLLPGFTLDIGVIFDAARP